MDPVTHGITGALLGKGYFAEKYGPAALFAVTLGSVFPDVDVVANFFSKDPLATIRFHRGFTHSFVGLPIFAAVLAALTFWVLKRCPRDRPPFWILFAAYSVGIASHIFLDAMTSYGTRFWNPISSHRYEWDWLFIVDFTLTTVVLLPQVLAWVYRDRGGVMPRAACAWIFFAAATMGVWKLADTMGFAFRLRSAFFILVLFALAIFLPLWRGAGLGYSRARWCRIGVCFMLVYLAACATVHHLALQRVRAFADASGVKAISEAAIPLPPSLLNWDGMVRTADGVYGSRFSLADTQPARFSFLADSPPNRLLSEALALPEVQTYLWFARFPVIRTFVENGNGVVEFTDVRFSLRRQVSEPAPFTFRVVMDPQGDLLEYEWAEAVSGFRIHQQKKGHGRAAGSPSP